MIAFLKRYWRALMTPASAPQTPEQAERRQQDDAW